MFAAFNNINDELQLKACCVYIAQRVKCSNTAQMANWKGLYLIR